MSDSLTPSTVPHLLEKIAARRVAWQPPSDRAPAPRLHGRSFADAPVRRAAAERIIRLLQAIQMPPYGPEYRGAMDALIDLRKALPPVSWAVIDLHLGRGMTLTEVATYLGEHKAYICERVGLALDHAAKHFQGSLAPNA